MTAAERIFSGAADSVSRVPSSFFCFTDRPSISLCTGRRRSRSMNSTFTPREAREMAVLAARVDLPSAADTLENRNTRRPLACSCWNFSAMRWMDSVKAKLMAGEEMFRFRRRRLPPRRARRSRRRSSNQPRSFRVRRPSWGTVEMILASRSLRAPSWVCTVPLLTLAQATPRAVSAAPAMAAIRQILGTL